MKFQEKTILTALFLMIVVFPSNDAFALSRVQCVFRWQENVEKNIASPSLDIGDVWISRKVREREYDRLLELGRVNARVSSEGGKTCILNHPENTLIDAKLNKKKLRLDPNGRQPSCYELSATVRCRGWL